MIRIDVDASRGLAGSVRAYYMAFRSKCKEVILFAKLSASRLLSSFFERFEQTTDQTRKKHLVFSEHLVGGIVLDLTTPTTHVVGFPGRVL